MPAQGAAPGGAPTGDVPNRPAYYAIELLRALRAKPPASRLGPARAGQPQLLASIFIGGILRPIIVAGFAAPGTLDLLVEPAHDQVIEDAAVAALQSRSPETK